MDIDEIKTLTDLMVENDLTEILVRDGDKRIILRRGGHTGPVVHMTHAAPMGQPHPGPTSPIHAPPISTPVAVPEAELPAIKSPMVGTFYSAPNPDSPAFVKVGDSVGPETVICIIEAMKVFNEIKAEITGTIESVEVSDRSPVEFGQPLMRVRPR